MQNTISQHSFVGLVTELTSMKFKDARRVHTSFSAGVERRTLVWLADQPTLKGYNPLIEMFWDPGIFRAPAHDRMVLLLSWLVTTLFCHFVLFAFQRARQRGV